jgi:ABC-type transport system involved in cytochrome c biogenesis permease subunit
MDGWLMTHIGLSLLSYGAFLVACISGVLFLVQERQLKLKQMGRLFHSLPSLASLDRLNLIAIALGFVLFTGGLLVGIAGRREALGQWMTLDAKEGLAYITWFSYAVLLVVRVLATLSHRKIALLSILGFSLVLFTFLGVETLIPSWHTTL